MDLDPPGGNHSGQVDPRSSPNTHTAELVPFLPGFRGREEEQRRARERQANDGHEDTVPMVSPNRSFHPNLTSMTVGTEAEADMKCCEAHRWPSSPSTYRSN